MTRSIPWFKFFPADFMKSVRGLSAQEVGLYIMVLCRMYEESGPVPFNVQRLAAYCEMRNASFQKAFDRLVVLGKLELANGMVTNARAEVEIADRANNLKNSTRAGKLRTEKMQRNQSDLAAPAERALNHTDTDTDTEIETGGGEARVAAQAAEVEKKESNETVRETLLAAMGIGPDGIIGPSKFLGTQADMAEAQRWFNLPGITVENACQEIARISASKHDGPPSRFSYFTSAIQRLSAALTAPPLQPLSPSPRASAVQAQPGLRIRAQLPAKQPEEPIE